MYGLDTPGTMQYMHYQWTTGMGWLIVMIWSDVAANEVNCDELHSL